MCGIAGYLRLDGAAADDETLSRMERALAHRGPDGAGLHRDGPLGFAHRRLSIIDLATGDQPMQRADLDRTVIFNGEIYNYLELREELLAAGHRFETRSDTEVLLVGHAAWGEELFAKLRGMFALALWESRARRLTLARDPLGKKPLQLCIRPGKLIAFASEAKALFALPEISRAIDPKAIGVFLDHLYVPEQIALFREIERLQAGELLVCERGRIDRRTFAADARAVIAPDLSFDAACAQLDRAVKQATRLRLRSDVPLGVFLSGGIDSTLVALAAAAQHEGTLRTFTVGFGDAIDERPFAAEVAKAIGAEHSELQVSLDAPALAREILSHFDEPFGDSSAVPTLAMSRVTRSAVKVVLAGDGGDEIFGGYGIYLRNLLNIGTSSDSPIRRAAGFALGEARRLARKLPVSVSGRIARLVRPLRGRIDAAADAQVGDPVLRQHLARRVSRSMSHAALLGPLLGAAASDQTFLELDARILARVPRGLSPLRTAMRVDRAVYLPGDILKKVDICSMKVGLEVRAPLLDDELIALADALPESFLVARLAGLAEEKFGKRPLKALVEKAMGAPFAYRPKQGFGAPLERWLRDPGFVSIAHEGFLSSASPIASWFTPGAREEIWRGQQAGKSWLSQEVWNLIALDAWARAVKPA